MGMYDYVDFECECPKCGKQLKGFQTKDLDCSLEQVKPWETERFYSFCNNCKTYIQYNRIVKDPPLKRVVPPAPEGWLNDYRMTYEEIKPNDTTKE